MNIQNENENINNSGGIDPGNCISINSGGIDDNNNAININDDKKLGDISLEGGKGLQGGNDVLITDIKVSSLNNVIDGIQFEPLTQTSPINDERLFRENEIRLFLGNDLGLRGDCIEKIVGRFRRLHKYGIKTYM